MSPAEQQRVAGLALQLVREHEPRLEVALSIGWKANFTARLGDARFERLLGAASLRRRRSKGHFGKCPDLGDILARVRFSSVLWPRADREEQDNTVAHEIAHLVVMYRYALHLAGSYGGSAYRAQRRPKAHGPEWQAVMRSMGYEPRRTHSIDRTGLEKKRVSRRTVAARCDCREDRLITPYIAKSVRAGFPYVCSACRGRIVVK